MRKIHNIKRVSLAPTKKKLNLFFRKFSKLSKLLLGNLFLECQFYVFPIKFSKILKFSGKQTGLLFFVAARETLFILWISLISTRISQLV